MTIMTAKVSNHTDIQSSVWAKLTRDFCYPKQSTQQGDCCTYLSPNHPIERPDLAIYSQDEQLALGSLPSWDNPDIITNSWRPFTLFPSSKIIVRNLSPKVSAVNALVHFFISPFGIGMPRTLLATKMVSISPSAQVELDFPLDATTLAGDQRIGVYIVLEHPQDGKSINNRGEQVHIGAYTTESGRIFDVTIPVLNNTNFTQKMVFSVLPTDLSALVSPTSHTFAQQEQININLHIEVPAALLGTLNNVINRAVTVIAKLDTGELVGGVSRLLRIDS
jgi:hypothetical protein